MEDVIDDFKDLGEKWVYKTSKERKELMKSLKGAWKNTAAKLILNFGKEIVPVVHAWADLMKHVQVDEKCDQDCAVKCLDVKAPFEHMFFDRTCLQNCNCRFALDALDAE